MTQVGVPVTVDRVEEFNVAVDGYEPTRVEGLDNTFRTFARLISRSLDARYLARHPVADLLPDLERLLEIGLVRTGADINVEIVPAHNSGGRRGVLFVCVQDQPFLLSTVLTTLDQLGLKRMRYLVNIVSIVRDSAGKLTTVGRQGGINESFIRIEIESSQLKKRRGELETKIRDQLAVAKVAVDAFHDIVSVVEQLAQRSEKLARGRPDQRRAHKSNAEFLRWLLAENFVFLGTKYLSGEFEPADTVRDLGVGTLEGWRGIQIEDAERAVHEAAGIPPFLWIRKSQSESCIYRAGPLDHVLLQCWDGQGRAAGLLVIEGIFSFRALAQARTEIPLLDRLIDQVFAEMQVIKGSHRYRTIRNAFNSLPLDYLFSLSSDDVRLVIEQMVEVGAENRLQIHITVEELQNFAFVFVALPRSHYSEELRIDIRRLLKERFKASFVDDGVYAGDAQSVTFHYFLTGVTAPETDTDLREEIESMARPWASRLEDALREHFNPEDAMQLYDTYGDAFPRRYREATSVMRAVRDIDLLESSGADEFACDIYREPADGRLGLTRLRMLQAGGLILSDILPALDNLGLVVIDEFPTAVHVPGQRERVIATFRIRGARGLDVDLLVRRNRLRAAIRAIMNHALENDPLNRLLLRADIPWTYVVLLRTYQNYLRQIGSPYSTTQVRDALEGHPEIVRGLMDLFRSKFDPGADGQSAYNVDERRRVLVDRSKNVLADLLDAVNDVTCVRILGSLRELVGATVRTNFYARDPLKDPAVVLKFDPSLLPRIPETASYREIYVHHPRFAGMYLRGGPVARGGIYWSDHMLDMRNELMGQMGAQNLTNVLAVPSGAKGSFVLRNTPQSQSEVRDAAEDAYVALIDALLSVTDNLVDGRIVRPGGVLDYDGDDHYLVAAGGRGTKHLADRANTIASRRSFWLGDAFATGGLEGYNHHALGMTARGTWACVTRHFREMGIDLTKDAITVAGIGEVGGHGFGEAFLTTGSVCLLAAFDDRYIFIDPNPDPMQSLEMRRKLFSTQGATWMDYPKEALSEGGGVYEREAKSVDLSAAARRILDFDEVTPTGHQVVKKILRMSVDLLWYSGSGTLIKSTSEEHVDVGDPINDTIRINATDLKARVFCESGHRGITSLARVEALQHGSQLNTDAVDGSAGVDLADHEVNLKIMLDALVHQGTFEHGASRTILKECEQEVCAQVIANNWMQSRCISLDVIRSTRDLPRFRRAIDFLSQRIPFKRRDMRLPGGRLLKQRATQGQGLLRSEAAVLMANAKNDLRRELLFSDAFSSDILHTHLEAYFPKLIRGRFAEHVAQHPLATEIAQTMLTNRIIGDAGASWLAESTQRTGKSTVEIVFAYLRASKMLKADAIKEAITDLEMTMSATTEYDMRLRVESAIETVGNWLLRRGYDTQPRFESIFRTTLHTIAQTPAFDTAGLSVDAINALRSNNVPEHFAHDIVVLDRVGEILDAAHLAFSIGADDSEACAAYFYVGKQTKILSLVRQAVHEAIDEDLERPARVALRDQLRRHLVKISGLWLTQSGVPTQQLVHRLRTDLSALAESVLSVPMLVIAVDTIERRLREVALPHTTNGNEQA